MAETGPPTRLAFFCDEHITTASAPREAVADALDACADARDGVLTTVWQTLSDQYPDPVRLDSDLRARAGIPADARWDILRRLPMSATRIGITTRIPNWLQPPSSDG
jgi:hypothetical protein